MKTLITALTLCICLTAFAQQPTPEQRQAKHLAHLTKELKLDAKQQEAVGKILAEKSNKMKDVKAKNEARSSTDKITPEEKAAMKANLKAEKLDTENKMKAILTPDQYKKWQAMRAENKEKIKENIN